MHSDSERTSQDDGSTDNEHSQKLSTSKSPPNMSGQQGKSSAWEGRLGELADYRKQHGHCNVPAIYSENSNLAKWAKNQRKQYWLHLEGKTSSITPSHIQELERLGFEWDCSGAAWKDRVSELADYRTIHGHCNVLYNYSENPKLAKWVTRQRRESWLRIEGKKSFLTLPRIKAMESLSFEWKWCSATWEDRLSELADYREIHGHCNVPRSYSNTTLGNWVVTQRRKYKLYQEGKISPMTLPRIQALESLSFEWQPSVARREGTLKKPRLDDDATRGRVDAPEHAQTTAPTQQAFSALEISAAMKSTSLSNPKNPTRMAKSHSPTFRGKPQRLRRLKAGDARFDGTDLDGSPSELAARPSL